ncbi:MAG: type II secretion system F family protein, partial [Candidatus Omnitrophica bacterium]|nr:type II secretion system F family protein [Candidatus Omnitrophota bacterium]
MADGVERGFKLSTMITAYPQIFPAWWEAFIVLAEQGGDLPRILRLLHRYIAERTSLRLQFFSALMTPALTAAAGTIAICVFLFGVLPRIVEYVVSMGALLPGPLGWYINHERLLLTALTLLMTLLFLAALIVAQYFKTSRGRLFLDQCRLRVPAFGILIRKYELLRIVHGLKIVVGQGASIPMGLETLARSMANLCVRQGLLDAAVDLDHGVPIPEALAAIPVLSPAGAQIVSVGWASGQLELMLDRYFERLTLEIIQDARDSVGIILHITLMVVALFVTFVLVAFYATLFIGLLQVSGFPKS